MPRIEATDEGFHWLDALGGVLAPDVYLNAGLDPKGRIALDEAGTQWLAEDTGGRVLLASDTALDPLAPGAGSDWIGITEMTFQRYEHGGWTDIGHIAFAEPLQVEVTHDGWGDGAWYGEVADAMADAVQTDGIVFQGGAGADVFDPGRDVLPVPGPQIFYGRGGDDVARTSRADAEAYGGSGDDHLVDLGGAAWLNGGPGDDVVELGAYSSGGVARGGIGDDLVISGNGDDALWGNAGADRLQGGRGADKLVGGPGNDQLDAGDGADTLRGGAGDDLLAGGWDADRFVFNAWQDGHDRITDFDATEDILLLFGAEPDAVQLVQDGDAVMLSWGGTAAVITIENILLDEFETALILL